MNKLSRFIVLICIFLIAFLTGILYTDNSCIEIKNTDTITSGQIYKQEVLTEESSVSVIQALQKNENFVLNNKRNDIFSNGGIDNIFFEKLTRFKAIISYIYNQSFLINKAKYVFAIIFSEINPNAP